MEQGADAHAPAARENQPRHKTAIKSNQCTMFVTVVGG